MSRKTSSRSSLGVVEKLIEQRRLFQDWLAKLDAGVEAMPPRVVERVRNDYRGRLQKVLAELAEQQDGVREALAEAESRHAVLEEQQTAKREELAELKLRRHVGEVDDADFKESNGLLKQAIDGLGKELGAALRDIERFEEILEAILRDQAPPAAAAAAPQPEAAALEATPEPEPAETEPEDEGEIVIPIAQPAPAPTPAPAAAPATAKPAVEDELAFLRSVTTAVPPVKGPRGRSGRPGSEEEADADAVMVEPSPSRKSLEMEAPALDEPPGHLEAAAHMVDLPPAPADETPPAPKPAPEADEEQGLVCGECGTPNRPTEWYCAKCGAELSAV
jgi:hypothetical protein